MKKKNRIFYLLWRPGGLYVSIFLAEKAKKDFHYNPWRSARDVKGLALLSRRAKSRGDSRARNSPLKRPKKDM